MMRLRPEAERSVDLTRRPLRRLFFARTGCSIVATLRHTWLTSGSFPSERGKSLR